MNWRKALGMREQQASGSDVNGGWYEITDRLSQSDRDRRKAANICVLDALYPIFGPMPLGYSGGGETPTDVASICKWQEKIDKTRAWAESVDDNIVKQEYIDWLDYYQKKLDQSHSKTEAEWWNRLRQNSEDESAERERLRLSLSIPQPPRLP